jgi:hypothetical protein
VCRERRESADADCRNRLPAEAAAASESLLLSMQSGSAA